MLNVFCWIYGKLSNTVMFDYRRSQSAGEVRLENKKKHLADDIWHFEIHCFEGNLTPVTYTIDIWICDR